MLIGAISIVRGLLLFVTQTVAGIVAAYIVKALFQGDLAVSTELGGGTTIAQGVIIELVLTAQLVFTIFMLAAEKHQGNFIAPVGIGLSLFIAELVGTSLLPSSQAQDTSIPFFPQPQFLHPLTRHPKLTCIILFYQASSGPAAPSTRPAPSGPQSPSTPSTPPNGSTGSVPSPAPSSPSSSTNSSRPSNTRARIRTRNWVLRLASRWMGVGGFPRWIERWGEGVEWFRWGW